MFASGVQGNVPCKLWFNQEYPKGVNARGLSGPTIISTKALPSRLVLGRALDPRASGTD